MHMIRISSAVEHWTVNPLVASSNLASGDTKKGQKICPFFYAFNYAYSTSTKLRFLRPSLTEPMSSAIIFFPR